MAVAALSEARRKNKNKTMRPPAFPLKVPDTTTAMLSQPDKMPCHSWGMPAGGSCPWAVYGEGTICDTCYAGKGSYTLYPNVKRAYQRRYDWAKQCMKTEMGRTEFIEAMITSIRLSVILNGEGYFRIHDSGDFFNEAYTRCWITIVQRMPDVKFWAPIRGWQKRNPWRHALQDLAKEPNIAVRPSALLFEAPPPRIEGFDAGTSASGIEWDCPAYWQNNECRDCRRCWDKTDEVIYHKH